jgi:N-acetyl-gamma-glutamyl-phosphate reductase
MIKAGIIGGAGFTGGELMRLLVNHPEVEVVFAHSNSQHGKMVSSVHKDLQGDIELEFKKEAPPQLDVLFLCLGHGNTKEYLRTSPTPESTKIIDLSHDFRINNETNPFIYGLPELNRDKIRTAGKVANPGCFATAIQLALLPLAANGFLKNEVHVNAVTGATGAGASLLPTTHFSWRQNNLSVYKAFEHQHLAEIHQSLQQADGSSSPNISFIPIRGDFAKGIFCTAYSKIDGSFIQFLEMYKDYYADHPFTIVSEESISLKDIINTNKCYLHLQYYEGKLLITSIIDNLIKGASGQAIQNMNLMSDLPERTGLNL